MNEPNYNDLPIDRLRWLAEHANQPSRSAARKALEARLLTAKPDEPPTYQVLVSASEFGTPRPEIRVIAPAARNHRELRGVLHDVAAGVERKLASTREAWHVEIRRVDEREGAVYLELMDGHQAEIDRALAVLHALVSPGAPTPARPRPRRERPAVATSHVDAAFALDAAVSGADAAARAAGDPAPQPELPHTELAAEPAAQQARVEQSRSARRAFKDLAGGRARGFEAAQLKRDRDTLPECATAVLDGAYRTAEYWTWLHERFVAAQGAG